MWPVLVVVVLVVAAGCSSDDDVADGNGRVIVEQHTEPDGRVVRAGLGAIRYDTHLDGAQDGTGLVIEVDDGTERRSISYPLPSIDGGFQMLGAFGGAVGHVSVVAAPADSVLTVRYRDGNEHALDVGPDGLAVVVSPSADDVDRIRADSPDGAQCQFLRAPSAEADCEGP